MRSFVPWSLLVALVVGLTGLPSLVGAGEGPASRAAAQDELPRLAELYADQFPIGVAIDERETSGPAGELLLQQFNQITAENHMKPYAWYTGPGAFRVHPQATAMMDFAQQHDLRVFGHVLVWHDQTPDWFFQDAAGRALTDSEDDQQVLEQRMRDHIFAIAEAFSDSYGPFGSDTNPLVAWDVVNEVVSDGSQHADGLRRSPWYEVLGEEFIHLAFQYADEAFNDVYAADDADRPVALFINEYSTEWPDKRGRYHDLVERLVAAGDVPIDGVGHQFHVSVNVAQVAALEAAIQRFQGMGLVQAVTEMDVGIPSPASAADLAAQGRYYADAFEVFRAYADELYSVSVWGLHDSRSWRGSESPLLFDGSLAPKPAFHAVADVGAPTTLTATLDPPVADGQEGWYVSPVTIALEASRTDAAAEWRLSGDDTWYPYLEPLVLAVDGVHLLEYRLASGSDAADVQETTLRIDRTAPVTTSSLDGVDEGVATGPVTLTLDATDATSGVDATHVRAVGDDDHDLYEGPVTYDEPGTYDLEVRSQDIAGNVETWRSVSFEITEQDVEPPTVDIELSPQSPDGQEGWWVSPVTVTLGSADPAATLEWRTGDGDDWEAADGPITFETDGRYDIQARATDPGGLFRTADVTVQLDRTAPVTTASLDGVTQGAATGPVTLTLDATDATSGVDATHVRAVGDDDHDLYDGPLTYDEPGTYDLEVRSQDVAGNVETWRSVTFEIIEPDVQPPAPVRSVCAGRTGGAIFADSPGSGHGAAIECLGSLRVVLGQGDGRFRPADDVSRGQLASFVVRALELATGEPMPAGSTGFSDVASGSTHGLAIAKLRTAGIIQGYPDGTFRPQDPVTRDQTARYMINALEHVTDTPLPTSGVGFPDVAAGNRYATDIDKLVTAGVVQGFPDGTYGPRAQVTRGQMARFVASSLEVLADQGAYRGD